MENTSPLTLLAQARALRWIATDPMVEVSADTRHACATLAEKIVAEVCSRLR